MCASSVKANFFPAKVAWNSSLHTTYDIQGTFRGNFQKADFVQILHGECKAQDRLGGYQTMGREYDRFASIFPAQVTKFA